MVPGFTPPDNWDDYIHFLTIFAQRYKGRIHYYQIWNEPNIYPEWGNNPVDPEAYTQVLCRAYQAIKAVDPANVVISAALSPTVNLSPDNLSDHVFLQRMYDDGAKGCFDIMATQGYGFFSGPTDQRMRPTTLNFARPLYLRDVMVANGDANKPIWISEAAWNPVDAPEVPPDLPGKDNFGSVTRDQAARYMPLAYQRAQQEWPWVGVIDYWFFKRAGDSEKNQPFYYFRMVEPDFTPLPVYDAMKQYITQQQPVLYAGVHQGEDWAIPTDNQTKMVGINGAQFGAARQAIDVTFTYHGTGLGLHWMGLLSNVLRISIDGGTPISSRAPAIETLDVIARPELWTNVIVGGQTFDAETHTVRLRAETPFLLDSVTVYDFSAQHRAPVIAIGAILGLLAAAEIARLLWQRITE